MARAVTLGNGNLLVGLDHLGQVRDFYFPNVGHANHVSGASGSYVHRIGVYADGKTVWLEDSSWQVEVTCDPETMVGNLKAYNQDLEVTLSSTDIVHNEYNVFIRSFVLTNESKKTREIKLFLSQQFRISESRRGDTGFYDPRVNAIVHYKGRYNFLVNSFMGDQQFTDYNIGLFGIEGKEGTFHDANDGVLEKNPIEHGSVDSVLGLSCKLSAGTSVPIHYWVVCGESIAEVHDLDKLIKNETPEVLRHSTENYWQAWIQKDHRDLSPLGEELQTLYKRSLTTMRVHADNRGAIIASSDTDMLHHGRDTYSYCWPRDGALIARAFDIAGYPDVARRFYTFITARLERGGYLMHKYRSDGYLGSSWHPWIIEGEPEFPIQEDETALVLYAIYKHYEQEKDLEFLESVYNPFIELAAEFMVEFVESRLGLPSNSFDLWEEKFGSSTYTASSVFGALTAASNIANLLGKEEAARTYAAVAQRMQSAIMEHLYDEELGMFVKSIRVHSTKDDIVDKTIDTSSFFGPLYFGVIDPEDQRVKKAAAVVEEKLRVHSASDGYIRYEGDNYYTMHEAGSPNPWVITTLWMAQYHIMKAKNKKDLERAYEILEWTCSHATVSGVLAEQMHPHTREHLSTAPLVWSHAEFVTTVHAYLEKLRELSS